MQNIVINMCEKCHYDRLRNDKALEHWKCDNKNPKKNNKNNNIGSAWGPVSGSKNKQLMYLKSTKQIYNNQFYKFFVCS